MKTIPLKQAAQYLDYAIALDLDGAGQDVRFNSWGWTDEDDDETSFLRIHWVNDDGDGFGLEFMPEDNREVQLDGFFMYLKEEDGSIEKIRLTFNWIDLEKLAILDEK